MHTFAVESVICTYPEYKGVWIALVDGRELACERMQGNPMYFNILHVATQFFYKFYTPVIEINFVEI